MPDDELDLPSLRQTGWAVLGLLAFGEELSGYDLKQWANWSLRFFYWAPSYSQIYNELRRLEELGLASSRVVSGEDEPRSKRLYRITPAGEAALRTWSEGTDPEPAVLKHGVMLRMWLGHTADPERLRRMLEEHRDLAEKMRRRAAADAEGASSEPGWAYPELVLRWSERYYADERDRAELMLSELAAAERKLRTGGRGGAARRTSVELRNHGR